MLNVIIEADRFPFSTRLKEILEERQAIVEYTGNNNLVSNKTQPSREAENCFLCSKDYFNSIDGQAGLINIAKGHKANSIVIVGQVDDTFSVKEELAGKLLHINFPKDDEHEDTINEYGS